MENEVWSEISAFLNNLRCGDVSRKSYLHFPELEEAEKIRKVKKANFETEMRKLNAEQRQQIENYLEAVGDGTVALSIKRRYGSALNQQKKERDFVRIAKAFQSRS